MIAEWRGGFQNRSREKAERYSLQRNGKKIENWRNKQGEGGRRRGKRKNREEEAA